MANGVEIQAEIFYRDPNAALEWLKSAFGFEPGLIVTGSDGVIIHARLETGGAAFAIGRGQSPATLGGAHAQIHVRFADSIDAHFARAVRAGAKILYKPRQEFYGDLTYSASDIEGHIWVFGQRDVQPPGPPPEGWHVKILRTET